MSGFLRTLAKVGLVELNEEEKRKLNLHSTVDEKPSTQSDFTHGGSPQGHKAFSTKELDKILGESLDDSSLLRGSEPQPKSSQRQQQSPGAKGETANPDRASGSTRTEPSTAASGIDSSHQPLKSFAEIYAEAEVPSSPFPAEKLLRLLEGLKAMEPGMRKAAVLAMDAADDTWTIEDSVLDAQRKARVLRDTQAVLDQELDQIKARAQADLEAQREYQAKATESIRQQIADLEKLLEQELEQVAHERAAIELRLSSAERARAEGVARIDAEIERLEVLQRIFAANNVPTK